MRCSSLKFTYCKLLFYGNIYCIKNKEMEIKVTTNEEEFENSENVEILARCTTVLYSVKPSVFLIVKPTTNM